MEIDNLFIFLDLPPDCEDDTVFLAAVDTKRTQLNKQVNSGRNANTAKAQLRQLAVYQKIWGNAADRKKAAEEAREILDRSHDQAVVLINGYINALRRFGSYTPDDLAKAAADVAKTFTKEEVEARFKGAGLTSNATAKPTSKTIPQLDSAAAKVVRDRLQRVGKPDLYAFLDMPRTSSTAALMRKADDLCKTETSHTNAGADIRDTASEARTVFGSEVRRAEYDGTLALAMMEPMRGQIIVAARNKVISADTYRDLIEECCKHGADQEEAEAFVFNVCVERDLEIRKASGPPIALIKCVSCDTLNREDVGLSSEGKLEKACFSCAEKLYAKCPKCDEATPASLRLCQSCGFTTGDAPLVKSIVERSEKFLREGKFVAARRALLEGAPFRLDWPEIAEADEALEEGEAPYQQLAESQKKLESQRRYQALSESWRASGLDESPDYRELVSNAGQARDQLARASELVAEAQAADKRGEADKAIDAYEQALALAIDYEPAKLGLANSPPEPAANVIAQAQGGAVSLEWQPPSQRRVLVYRVIRKVGSRPATATDGDLVADNVPNAWLDDPNPPRGLAVYYGVLVNRGGALSRQMAVSGPVLMPEPPADATISPGEGIATLRWAIPPGAREIVVRRSSPNDGAGVREVQRGRNVDLFDTGLTNGFVYRYDISAIYPDPQDATKTIEGPTTSLTAVPDRPPEPVTDLRMDVSAGLMALTWTRVDAPVAIYRVDKGPAVPPEGDFRPIADLEAAGMQRLGPPSNSGTFTGPEPGMGRHLLVPLSVQGSSARIGRAVALDRLQPVQDLQARRDGYEVLCSWRWPKGCRQAAIVWGDRVASTPDDKLAGRMLEAGLPSAATAEIRVLPSKPGAITISVFAIYDDAHALPAEASVWTGGDVRLSYRVGVKRKWRFTGPAVDVSLELIADQNMITPELLCVVKKGMTPAHAADGEVIFEIAPTRIEGVEGFNIPLPEKHWGQDSYIRLDVKPGAEVKGVLLEQPSGDKVRMG